MSNLSREGREKGCGIMLAAAAAAVVVSHLLTYATCGSLGPWPWTPMETYTYTPPPPPRPEKES